MGNNKISSDATVILALSKKQPLTPQKIIDETRLSKSSTYRAIKRLLNAKVVKLVGKRKYALQDFSSEEEKISNFLEDWKRKHGDLPPPIDEVMLSANKDPEDVKARKDVRSILAKYDCNPSPPVPYEDRRRHTQELMEVIKSWKELPSASDFGVDVVKISHDIGIAGDRPLYKGQQELAFERHTLFPDLRNHLEPEVFETWGKFKEETKRFWSTREKLTGKIEKMLKEKLHFVGVHDGRGDLKCGFITPDLIEFVLRVAYTQPDERWRRMFADYFVTGLRESKLEDGYLISSVGTGVFRISHREDVEKTKENMRHAVEEVRENHSSELESLRGSLSTLEGHRGEIIRVLEKHIYMPVLGGYCEYLILPPRTT
jgi:DNA-binding transcriptional regulator GbsR (MarR family)